MQRSENMDSNKELLNNENLKQKKIKKIKVFCPFCEKEHEVQIVEFIAQDKIKDSLIQYISKAYECKITNELFEDGELLDKNLDEMREQYRIKNNLLTKKQIKDIRNKYNLTQEDLALILGLGVKTITRYETTAIQERAYDNLLREFEEDYDFALNMLKQSKDKINADRYNSIYERIKGFIVYENKNKNLEKSLKDEYILYDKESTENGYRLLDTNKIKNMLIYFSKNVKNLFEVKLMKLFWYADALCYLKTGKAITGLVYNHQKFGALPIGYETFIQFETVQQETKQISDNIAIEFKPKKGYEFDETLFSGSEIDILETIATKFKDCTGTQLSNIMHDENAYKLSKDREIIDFSLIKKLKAI